MDLNGKVVEDTFSFQEVRVDTFSPAVVVACAVRLRPILPHVEVLLSDAPEGFRIEHARRHFQDTDLNSLESFMFLGKLLLVGFGPARIDDYDQSFLREILPCVKRHLWLAENMGIVKDFREPDGPI